MNQKATESTAKEIVIMPESAPARIDVDPQSLIASAIDKNVPLETLEKLLSMRDRLRAEAAEREYWDAMSKFQADCPIIVKSNGVDYTSKKSGTRVKYNYAALDVIVSSVRELIASNGFSYKFTTEQKPESVTAICHVHHVGGHTESTAFTVPVDPDAYMNAAQKVASALTYAKRYAFCNGFGILTGEEDNDGGAGEDDKRMGNGHPTPSTKIADKNSEIEKAKSEISAKIEALPANIKDGFKNLGYGARAIVALCNKYEWDNDKIYSAINAIIDNGAK